MVHGKGNVNIYTTLGSFEESSKAPRLKSIDDDKPIILETMYSHRGQASIAKSRHSSIGSRMSVNSKESLGSRGSSHIR